jgi:hypothetical protein
VGDEELRAIADELERASLLVRVAARARRAGSEKAAAQTLCEALEIIGRYVGSGLPDDSVVRARTPSALRIERVVDEPARHVADGVGGT